MTSSTHKEERFPVLHLCHHLFLLKLALSEFLITLISLILKSSLLLNQLYLILNLSLHPILKPPSSILKTRHSPTPPPTNLQVTIDNVTYTVPSKKKYNIREDPVFIDSASSTSFTSTCNKSFSKKHNDR